MDTCRLYVETANKHSIDYEPAEQAHIHYQHLKTKPFLHQISMIEEMRQFRKRMTEGFSHENEFITGKLGILADPPGSGKTLSVLGYIGLHEEVVPRLGDLNTHSNRYFVSHQAPLRQDGSSITVVIVPTHLLTQWQEEVERHTHLKVFTISNRRILRNHSTGHLLCRSDFILTTNRLWKDVYAYTQKEHILWKNLFIDEATSIYFSPMDGVPAFGFLWLITSNWLSLQFRNQHLNVTDSDQRNWIYCTTESSAFYKQLVPWTHPLRYLLLLRNNPSMSYPYPSLERQEIHCQQQYTLLNLPPSILGTNYDGLTHSRIPTLFSALHVPMYTADMLKQQFGRSELIDSKQKDDCSICLDPTQHTVFVPCCMNVFCGACILRQLIMSGVCPTCRAELTLAHLHPLLLDCSQNQQVLRTKLDTCFQYIQQHMTNTNAFLVYTTYENTYYQLQPQFTEAGISCDNIELHSQRIAKSVANFNSGRTKVLFISNVDAIRGLTLSRATHLILFYAVPSSEREQILIHSMQRVGSQGPKQVLQLTAVLDT